MKKDKKKKDDWDDGRTVAPMGAEWMPWNHGTRAARPKKTNSPDTQGGEGERLRLTKAERRGILLGALRAVWPILVCLAVAVVFMYFFARIWLG